MIVVHIDSMEDTSILKKVYEGLDDIKLLVNPTRKQLREMLKENPTERLLVMGHGTSFGLLNANLTGFILTSEDATLLRSREVVGIFCYASSFAQMEGLHGFFTSMFISNQNEASVYGYDADNSDVFNEVSLFSQRLNTLFRNQTALSEWADILRSQADYSKDYVAFNYDGLRSY